MKTLFIGKIFTMNAQNIIAKELVVKQDKIIYVGNHYSGKVDKKIELGNKILLPGFIDTHTHFFELAKRKIQIDLSHATSLEEVKKILLQYKKTMPKELKWIGGSGWNKNIYPSLKGFNRYFLDEIFPDIPVSLESKDFHSKWCNSLALEKAGITNKTPDPEGGFIGRFKNGEPNGFTHEKAWELIDRVVPALPQKIQLQILKSQVQDCYKMGLVGVHCMEGESKFELYKHFLENGGIFRFCWHFPSTITKKIIEQGIVSYTGSEWLKYGGQKIFMDGAVGAQTAFMYSPYPNSENYGTMIYTEEQLEEKVKFGVNHGISSSIHAIGDRCVHLVTSVLKRNSKENIMHRIEHLQCIRDEDLELLANTNIYAAMQPIHIKEDIETMAKQWPIAKENAYRFKTLLDRNISIGFGSDAPVETINPMQGIYSAIERKPHNLPDKPTWNEAEKINVYDALKAYTIDAAKGSQSENLRGSLEVGKLADMIVIDDFSHANSSFWLKAESYLTMINGTIVHDKL